MWAAAVSSPFSEALVLGVAASVGMISTTGSEHPGAQPYEFIGFGAMDVTKPYQFIWFGDLHGAKPYEFIGFRWALISQTPVVPAPRPKLQTLIEVAKPSCA